MITGLAKIVTMITGLAILTFALFLTWNFIKDTINHNKRMRKLDQWSNFHQKLIDWSKEIQDAKVRDNFINECVSRLVLGESDRLDFDKDMLDDWDINEAKKNIYEKWGKHIPSLTQEIREKKLSKIL